VLVGIKTGSVFVGIAFVGGTKVDDGRLFVVFVNTELMVDLGSAEHAVKNRIKIITRNDVWSVFFILTILLMVLR
jgi:hypothetical protein